MGTGRVSDILRRSVADPAVAPWFPGPFRKPRGPCSAILRSLDIQRVSRHARCQRPCRPGRDRRTDTRPVAVGIRSFRPSQRARIDEKANFPVIPSSCIYRTVVQALVGGGPTLPASPDQAWLPSIRRVAHSARLGYLLRRCPRYRDRDRVGASAGPGGWPVEWFRIAFPQWPGWCPKFGMHSPDSAVPAGGASCMVRTRPVSLSTAAKDS